MLAAHFGRWKQEWAYAQQMVAEDPRNNSAWNQRGWLLGKSLSARLKRQADLEAQSPDQSDKALQEDPSDLQPRFLTGSIRDWLDRELQFVKDHIFSMPHNESAWNYLVGLRDVILDVLRCEFETGMLQHPSPDPGSQLRPQSATSRGDVRDADLKIVFPIHT